MRLAREAFQLGMDVPADALTLRSVMLLPTCAPSSGSMGVVVRGMTDAARQGLSELQAGDHARSAEREPDR